MITPKSIISRVNDGLLISELGNELVMMNTETGSYLGLNDVGTDIWKLIEHPVTVEQITLKLIDLYEVNKDDCQSQTIACLNKMLEQGLIVAN